MEYENKNFASKGVANTALVLGSVGAASLLANGGVLGNVFGGGNHCVSQREAELQNQIAARESRIGLLESNIYTDSKIADVYERLNNKVSVIEAQISQQNVVNANIAANLSCLQNTVATLSGLTKTVIPIASICPEPMPQYNSWVAPTATT